MNKLHMLKLKQDLYAVKLRLKKPTIRTNNVILKEYESSWEKARMYENIIKPIHDKKILP